MDATRLLPLSGIAFVALVVIPVFRSEVSTPVHGGR
jgi:hypothetical protein